MQIYEFANGGNHLHLLIRIRDRRTYRCFIRGISSSVARLTLGVTRSVSKGIQFWDAIPFTRIVDWGRSFHRAKSYVIQNALEAFGVIEYQQRAQRFSG